MKGETEKLRAGTNADLVATERRPGNILLHAFMVINYLMICSCNQHRASLGKMIRFLLTLEGDEVGGAGESLG